MKDYKNRLGYVLLAGAFLLAVFAAVPFYQTKAAPSAAFTAGNLVVFRAGSGTGSLINTGNPIFLDEFTPSGTLVQSIALPVTATGANQPCVTSGTATSEGFLTRSTDGRYIILSCYASTLPGSASLSTTAVPRVVARIDAAGNIDTTTALTDYATGNNPRGATSTNGTDLWFTGGAGGVRYATLGSTTSTQLSTTVTNIRATSIFDGQLYISTSSGSAVRVGAVGTGTPTTSGQTITNIPAFPVVGSPYGFFFADLDAGVAGLDTVYVADDATTTGATGGGLKKFSLVGGSWTYNGTFPANGVTIPATIFYGVTGTVSGTTATLYATRGGTQLVSFVDSTGYNVAPTAIPTLVSTANINTAFRGVALAPVSGTTATPTPQRPNVDFNGDRKSDYVVTRNVNDGANLPNLSKYWYVSPDTIGTFTTSQIGLDTDVEIPADFDGDGRADVAVWRAGAPFQAAFYILQSSTNTVRTEVFGQTGDIPNVTADYDGDGKADPAIYRAGAAGQSGVYAYRGSLNNTGGSISVVQWGTGPNVRPYTGDFDGDGKADFCVNAANAGSQQFLLLKNGSFTAEFISWGLATDKLVSGDFDADGKSDFCVVRTDSNNQLIWYVLTRAGTTNFVAWGLGSDQLTPGDYDGDGRADLAVWRSSGIPSFLILRSSNTTFQSVAWGAATDTPAANWATRP